MTRRPFLILHVFEIWLMLSHRTSSASVGEVLSCEKLDTNHCLNPRMRHYGAIDLVSFCIFFGVWLMLSHCTSPASAGGVFLCRLAVAEIISIRPPDTERYQQYRKNPPEHVTGMRLRSGFATSHPGPLKGLMPT